VCTGKIVPKNRAQERRKGTWEGTEKIKHYSAAKTRPCDPRCLNTEMGTRILPFGGPTSGREWPYVQKKGGGIGSRTIKEEGGSDQGGSDRKTKNVKVRSWDQKGKVTGG